MERREIVRRAIEFDCPPRLPFFQHDVEGVPDDVCDTWEMDRARNGWFFDCAAEDDWGCGWSVTDVENMATPGTRSTSSGSNRRWPRLAIAMWW